MAPICVKCKKTMRCKKNEFYVKDKEVDPFPATVWSGDMYECPECGMQIVTGFGKPFPSGKVREAYVDQAMEFDH